MSTLNQQPVRVSLLFFWAVSLIAAVGGFLFGFDTAVISGTIPFLKTQYALSESIQGWVFTSDITTIFGMIPFLGSLSNSIGWVVASALYGCVLGACIAGMISDRFGRKKALILAAILFLVSAVTSAIPNTVNQLVVARIIGGVGVGIASMLSPLYLSEMSPAAVRGRMVALYQLAITFGILCAYFANALIESYAGTWSSMVAPCCERIFTEPWRAMFGTEAIPAFLFMMFMCFVPESPRWLVLHEKTDKAKRILDKVVGGQKAREEIDAIQRASLEEEGSFRELFAPRFRIPLIIGILLPLFAQLSGINAIMYYGPDIFKAAGLQLGDSLGGQVVIGIINFVFTFVAILTVDRLGRRPLILIGTAGLLLSLLGCSAVYYFNVQSSTLLVLPFAAFVAFFAFSLGPLPWIVISEIFPNHVRGRAMSLGTFTVWACCIIVTQSFPSITAWRGVSAAFGFYFVMLLPCIPVIYWLLPETKGKSLEAIQAEWR